MLLLCSVVLSTTLSAAQTLQRRIIRQFINNGLVLDEKLFRLVRCISEENENFVEVLLI